MWVIFSTEAHLNARTLLLDVNILGCLKITELLFPIPIHTSFIVSTLKCLLQFIRQLKTF